MTALCDITRAGGTPPCAAEGPHTARAFTLVELLIVLAILVALGALVGPALRSWLREYRFRETLTQVESTLTRVRADAQRKGTGIEVFVQSRDGRERLACRKVDFAEASPVSDQTPGLSPPTEATLLELPSGVSFLKAAPPSGEAEGLAPPPVPVGEAERAESQEPREIVLVLFLPDGSAARRGVARLSDRSGRQAELRVNTWTGGVSLAPVDSGPVEALPARGSGGSGPRRRRSGGRLGGVGGAVVPARRRAAILLETVIALAIFIVGALAVMAMVNRAAASMGLARDYRAAADLARSAMARMEAGIATPQSLNGPVAAWGADGTDEDAALAEEGFDDAPPPPGEWALQVQTEPSSFTGLTLVTVKAVRQSSPDSDRARVAFSMSQLVRLGSSEADSVGDRDPISEESAGGRSRGRGNAVDGGAP